MREKVWFCVVLCCLVVMVLLVFCCYFLFDFLVEGMSWKIKDFLIYFFKYYYMWNMNLEVLDDLVCLEYFLLKDVYVNLYKGDCVVVVEFFVYLQDSVDSIWVKVVYFQEVQGWVCNKELVCLFVLIDSILQFIYLFSDIYVLYFVFIFVLFVGVYLFCVFMKKWLQMVYFNDIDSVYLLFFCLLMVFSVIVYEMMQVFVFDIWEYFYFNFILFLFKVFFIFLVFLIGIWLFIIVILVVFDDLFCQFIFVVVVFYLLGLMLCCIFCYFFFIFIIYIYIGYFFLVCFIWFFVKKVCRGFGYKYCCGNCGQKFWEKG